ncbi:MAG TPA: SDR family oxidoreductase [Acidimicrobiales bacterium]|jgi:NAD(P)-dependent dehydrogenase (short-subunit alcohol dehydrogenase family)|nr:SDR family oxidoreductase [Acidimicrobiales bacterium]
MSDADQTKVAFVTGGAIGFGRAFARALARQGWTVALADIDSEAAGRTAAELDAEGLASMAVACDVADDDQVSSAVNQVVEQVGDIGILINNAGKHLTKYNQPFGQLTIDEIRSVFEVNVLGVVRCSMACRDSMRRRGGGSIVNISSIAGYQPVSPYGVTKLAVRGLTIALATEFSTDNIRVNAVAPGLTATESALADLPKSLVDEFVVERQLVHRIGQMEDVVSAVLYLCSDAATFLTGETLKVSGGYPLAI